MDWTTTVNTFLTVGVTLAVCLINNYAQQKRTQNEFKVSFEKFSEMTTFKIDSLASEVREHNQFARRMPVVEEQITTINRRLEALERRVNE